MLLALAMITVSICTVLCGESCLAVSQGNSVNLTCSGQSHDKFRHIYWRTNSTDMASCYDTNSDCYINDPTSYKADRKDPSDLSFESSLVIFNVSKDLVINCSLWQAEKKNVRTLINTTRVVVGGACDLQDKEAQLLPNTHKSYPTSTLPRNLLQNPSTEVSTASTDSTISTAPTITTPTLATPTDIITPNTAREIKTEYSLNDNKDKSNDELSPLSLILLGIIGMIVSVVLMFLVRWRLGKRRKCPNVIPIFNDHYDLPEGEGHIYNTINLSADVPYSSVSPTPALPLPPRPIRLCHNELTEASLQPPAYSEIYETRTLLNNVQINESSTHHAAWGEPWQSADNDQLQDAPTRRYHRSAPTMKTPQTFQYNRTSTEPNYPPPVYNSSIRMKPTNWHSATFNPDLDYIVAIPPPSHYVT